MDIRTTQTFDKICDGLDKRKNIAQGGTSSGKTYSILQLLYTIACNSNVPLIISIVSETMPHLRRGAMRDFFNILGDNYDKSAHNKSESIYRVNKSQIEFFSADIESKVRGSRRDILFINECNNVRRDTYDQLEVRTKRNVFLDFNPVAEFWAHEEAKYDDAHFSISTYKDNNMLDSSIIKSIESRKDRDPNWWKVYGLGQIGSLEGLVLPDFKQVKTLPKEPDYYGMDFGYTNDPTTLVGVCIANDSIYVKEYLYRTGMTNQEICKHLKSINIDRKVPIYADSAEPKSIAEIHLQGFNIKPTIKGRDSLDIGFDYIKRFDLCVEQNSINLIKELRNYQYGKDLNGKLSNKPIDNWNHCIDALRYALTQKISANQIVRAGRIAF